MRQLRSQTVDPDLSCIYHVTSRCVNGDFLLNDPQGATKRFMYEQLRRLHDAFAIEISHYGLLDSHMHLVLRLNPLLAQSWTSLQVAQRWAAIHPPRIKRRQHREAAIEAWIQEKAADEAWVTRTRTKLASLSQFMKDLKQPVTCFVNERAGRFGPLWAQRFNAAALVDVEGLLATGIYVDLNVFAAGGHDSPEKAPCTSLQERCQALQQHGAQAAETTLWLLPIEARTTDDTTAAQAHQGMIRGLTLLAYLILLDAIARMLREGKAHLREDALPILQRLGVEEQTLVDLVHSLRDAKHRSGHLFGSPRRVRELLERRRALQVQA